MLALAVVPILVFADEMPAADFSGLVVGVIDGDSLTAMNQGKAEHVRLLGIDGPEKKQPFGARAKQFTSTKRGSADLRYLTT